PDRAPAADRRDGEEQHPHGGVRRPAAGPRPVGGRGIAAGGDHPAAADPDDDGLDRAGRTAARARRRRRRRGARRDRRRDLRGPVVRRLLHAVPHAGDLSQTGALPPAAGAPRRGAGARTARRRGHGFGAARARGRRMKPGWHSRRPWFAAGLAGLAILFAGCATEPPTVDPPTLGITPEDTYAAAPIDAPRPAPEDLRWWHRFDDPALAVWVERALAGHPDIAIAHERVRQARALLDTAKAQRSPLVTTQLRAALGSRGAGARGGDPRA